MILVMLAALGAGLTVFLAVGALTGQFAYSQRRMAARVVTLERQAGDPRAPRSGPAILKEQGLARSAALNALLGRFSWATRQARLLDRADLPVKVSEFILLEGLGAIAVAFVTAAVSGLVWVGLIFGVVTVIVAEWWLRNRARRRLQRFESQLPTALEVMATSLKSGFGVLEALATVAREMDDPLSREFKRVVEETRVGGSFERGLRDMVDRMESNDLRIVARALEVHRKVGGNLAEVLDSVSHTMREREELRGHIRALTAQQRLSIVIVSLLPVWAVGFFLVMDPDFVSPLWEHEVGRILLGLGIVLETISIFLMRKLVSIEV